MLKARFIGIDQHQDPKIPDLSGAVRDARALYSLFSDTIHGIDAKLIVNQQATKVSFQTAIEETLEAAESEDLVIISFSGHGTHDHRLAVYDTSIDLYESSTISMAYIANKFKDTKAKAVICILDCCFSGGAPARVLEDSPLDRDLPFEGETFIGSGRVMITASGLSESAYEHPVKRHGLLTKALIDVLTQSKGMVSLASALDKVQSIVRADAASMGVIQRPVLFGQIDGGFTIPALIKGEKYQLAFPEATSIKVSNRIEDLITIGIPQPVVNVWMDKFPNGLNALQLKAINEYQILQGQSLIVVAPTSAGKTFIGEMAAVRAITEGRKVVFLLPYRALVNEKYEDFSSLYAERLGLRVIRCCGDYVDDTSTFLKGKFDICVLTFEMFLSLIITHPPILNYLGLIVLDEAQFIADSHRGVSVELLLTYLRTVRQWGIKPQLVLLSATIGELNYFHLWIDVKPIISEVRPVPLEIGVLDRCGIYEYIDNNGKHQIKQLLLPNQVVQRRSKPSSQDVIIPLVQKLLSNQKTKEKILIFRNERGKAEGCAKYLANELCLSPVTSVIESLPSHDLSNASNGLRQALRGGTAFHNTNLTRDERMRIEQEFRNPESPLKVLCATTTVAAGINTPASTVIIVEHDFPWEGTILSVAEVKNMAGRAGRLGFRETGTAIILAESSFEREQLFNNYILTNPEPLTSSFREDEVGTWVLHLLAQIQGIKEDELIGVISNTYGGYLNNLNDPGWQKRTELQLSELLPRLIENGLLEHDENLLRLTLLGKACGSSSLTLESSLQLIEMLRAMIPTGISAEKLMVLIQALPELDNQYTPLFKKGSKESKWTSQVSIRFGSNTIQVLQRHAKDLMAYYARAKRVCILDDWIKGISTNEMEKRYSINPYQGSLAAGDIRSIADTTRFYLRSASQIISLLAPAEFPDLTVIETLLKQLETGLPLKALDLLNLPITLGRGEYLALVGNNILTVSSFWGMTSDQITAILGFERAKQLKKFKPAS
jgi:helicase